MPKPDLPVDLVADLERIQANRILEGRPDSGKRNGHAQNSVCLAW
jgi:hypothetical protein